MKKNKRIKEIKEEYDKNDTLDYYFYLLSNRFIKKEDIEKNYYKNTIFYFSIFTLMITVFSIFMWNDDIISNFLNIDITLFGLLRFLFVIIITATTICSIPIENNNPIECKDKKKEIEKMKEYFLTENGLKKMLNCENKTYLYKKYKKKIDFNAEFKTLLNDSLYNNQDCLKNMFNTQLDNKNKNLNIENA